jgi:ABC-type uncharacterized transport system substrate-binding protein
LTAAEKTEGTGPTRPDHAADTARRQGGYRVIGRRELMFLLGAAMTPGRALRAQQKELPVIGWLSGISPGPSAHYVAAFRQGLSETGYVEGQNLTIEYRWAEGRYDRLPVLAADLVRSKVDVIAAIGSPSARIAKSTTSIIPIIFGGADPVGEGLVASLARPGGNLTGFSMMAPDLEPKELELLSELVPQAGMIGLLVNPKNPNTGRMIRDVQDAARAKGVQLQIVTPAPRTKSMPPSPPSPNCMPVRSSSAPMRSSTATATRSWALHHAMPFRRSIRGARQPQRVG